MLHREDGNSGSAWSITEEHLTVPVVSTTQHEEPFDNHELTDENSEMNVSSLGPTLLIGLDKNFFDQGDDSKDVIFIENSELKFATSELKIDGSSFSSQKPFLSSGNYLISFVDRSKAPIQWENTALRNIRKMRPDVGCPLTDEIIYDAPAITSSLAGIKQDDDPSLFKAAGTLVAAAFEGSSSTIIGEKNILEDSECLGSCSQLTSVEKTTEERQEKCVPEIAQVSLPLKKKAKMKFSETAIFGTGETLGGSLSTTAVSSGMSELSKKCPAVSKNEKEWKRRAHRKRRCCYSESDTSDVDDAISPEWGAIATSQSYQNANDLVQDLKSKTLVDDDFAELVLSGIAELKVDVMKELKEPSAGDQTGNQKFSHELLAFAFLLYFKRRPAYQYLRTVFHDSWPTVQNLKEWRKLVNSNPKRRKKLLKKRQTLNSVSS